MATLLENQLVEEAVLLAETIAAVEANRDSIAAEEVLGGPPGHVGWQVLLVVFGDEN